MHDQQNIKKIQIEVAVLSSRMVCRLPIQAVYIINYPLFLQQTYDVSRGTHVHALLQLITT